MQEMDAVNGCSKGIFDRNTSYDNNPPHPTKSPFVTAQLAAQLGR